jgi:hypothetical protein
MLSLPAIPDDNLNGGTTTSPVLGDALEQFVGGE